MMGKWTAVCDVCGFEFKSDQLKSRWDGLMVCASDWEPRHPMDFIKPKKEESQNLPWTRPEPADVYIDVTYVDTGNNDIPSGTNNNSLD